MRRSSSPIGAFASALDKLVGDAIEAHLASESFQEMLRVETAKKISVYVTHEFTNGGHLWSRVSDEITERLQERDLVPMIDEVIASNLPGLVESAAKRMLSARVQGELQRLQDAGKL